MIYSASAKTAVARTIAVAIEVDGTMIYETIVVATLSSETERYFVSHGAIPKIQWETPEPPENWPAPKVFFLSSRGHSKEEWSKIKVAVDEAFQVWGDK